MDNECSNISWPWFGLGLPIGLIVGLFTAAAVKMSVVGPAVGIPLGTGLGFALDAKYNKNPKPLTAVQLKMIMNILLITLGGGILLIIILVWLYFQHISA